jgi:NAD(P)-dependent dehydrogenase (short-subunit alcohol dehydrogenase family)
MADAWSTAFLTGGGSGIGLRLGELLARRKLQLAVFDLKLNDEARRKLGSPGTRVSFHEVDVRDAEALDAAVRAAVAEVGPPQLAINCAGVQRTAPFDQLSAETFDFVIDVNLRGSRNFAAAVLPHLAPGGRLVLVSSLAGLVGNFGYAAYNASKFGVVGLASALRIEYRPRGILVTVVCPPEIETPMVVAERQQAHPVTMATKQFAGVVELDAACNDILRGAERGEWMVITGGRARLTRHLARLFPGLMNRITDRMVADELRKLGT